MPTRDHPGRSKAGDFLSKETGDTSMALEDIIITRRSVRKFTDEPVSKEEILKLLDMA